VDTSFLKRLIVPYSAITTASLVFTFSKAKAATLVDIGREMLKNGDVSHGRYSGKAIAERGGGLGEFKHLFENMDAISGYIMKALDWVNNLPVSIPKMTADLLTTIYHFLAKIVLQTPLFIFSNPYLKNTSLTFAVISITLVTIFTVFEAFMMIFNKKHTDLKTIAKRWSIVASITGFMPFAFETGFNFINKLSDGITNIGINGGNANGLICFDKNEEVLNNVEKIIKCPKLGWFDTLVIILFDITAISMLIPICLQSARRWWDLLVLCAISPLALSSWCFDRHSHYFRKWLDNVKTHSLTQLVYAVYILLIGIMIFSTQSIQGGFITLVIKILLVIAGLNKLAHPPQFIKRMTDNGEDLVDEFTKTKKTFANMYNTLTFKGLRSTGFIKGKIEKATNRKLRNKYGRRHVDFDQMEKDLRIKHGKRYIKDLL
jgi:hypothetical protein